MIPIPLKQARTYRRGRKKPIGLIVIHSMEAAEKGTTAEAVANWFAGPNAPKASAHYCVDEDSIVQCVRVEDTAAHAPGANDDGIGIELAGYAKQTDFDWLDEYSAAMLRLAASLVAELCFTHNIPAVFVNQAGLQRGERGITTHAAVSAAFGKSSHWDPGPNFPMEWFLEAVRGDLAGHQLLAAKYGDA